MTKLKMKGKVKKLTHRIMQDVQLLRQWVRDASHAYYVESSTNIPDDMFDMGYDCLRGIDDSTDPESPLWDVGAEDIDGVLIKHNKPVRSMDKVNNEEDLNAWLRKQPIRSDMFTVEPKLDGMTLVLMYSNDKLESGAARGNGLTGTDMTEHARRIPSIPNKLKLGNAYWKVEVQGEVVITNENFALLNELLIRDGAKPMNDQRSAASGIMRTTNPKPEYLRLLTFYPFLFDCNKNIGNTHGSTMEDACKAGFLTLTPTKRKFESVAEYIERLNSLRYTLPYPIDGAVVKYDRLDDRHHNRGTSKYTGWCIAYKYPPATASAVLLSVELTVGMSGVITPVGKIEPTLCGGIMVSSVNFANFGKIEAMDIRIGDTIVIRRAGDVIPDISHVDKEARKGNKTKLVKYKPPTTCPLHDAPIVNDPTTVKRFCSDNNCPGVVKARLCHYVSKDAMNIVGIGESTVDVLVKGGVVYPYQLYSLTVDSLTEMGVGSAKASTIIHAIEASKETTPHQILYSLAIPTIGLERARRIMNRVIFFDLLLKYDTRDLATIPGVGIITARAITSWFNVNAESYEKLFECGLKFTDAVRSTGEKVVVSGVLRRVERRALLDMLNSRGVAAQPTVTRGTSWLIVGDNAGNKVKIANKLGVTILTEEEAIAKWDLPV